MDTGAPYFTTTVDIVNETNIPSHQFWKKNALINPPPKKKQKKQKQKQKPLTTAYEIKGTYPISHQCHRVTNFIPFRSLSCKPFWDKFIEWPQNDTEYYRI